MAGIPLVNSNDVNDINTSIIAIKKEINSVGNTDVNVTVNLPDSIIPVDEVTSGNMQSVTSNAVYNALLKEDTQSFTTSYKTGNFTFTRIGKIVYLQSNGDWMDLPAEQELSLFNIPAIFRPREQVFLKEQSYTNIRLSIGTDGGVTVYNYNSAVARINGQYNGCWVAAN